LFRRHLVRVQAARSRWSMASNAPRKAAKCRQSKPASGVALQRQGLLHHEVTPCRPSPCWCRWPGVARRARGRSHP
jgi:hypothetical protein